MGTPEHRSAAGAAAHRCSERTGLRGRWTWLAALLALPFPAWVLLQIARHAVNVPFWDEWTVLMFVDRCLRGEFSLGELFAVHMGHRLVLTRLIYLLVYTLFRGNVIVVPFVQAAVQAALLWITARRILALFPPGSLARLLLPGFASALLFAPQAVGGLWLFGFAVQQSLTGLFYVLALFALAPPTPSRGRVLLAWGLAGLATLSSGLGLAAWPALCLTALLGGSKKRHAAATGLIGIAVVIAYVAHGLTSERAVLPVTGLDRLRYVAVFLGCPFGCDRLAVAQGLGAAGLAAYAVCAIGAVRSDIRRRRPLLPWLALPLLPVAAACAGAWTRLGTVAGLAQALDSRYRTLSALFWIGLAVGAAGLARQGSSAPRLRRSVGIGALAAMACAYLATSGQVKIFANAMQDIRYTRYVLRSGCYVYRDPGFVGLYPGARYVIKRLNILRSRGLPPFDEAYAPPVGRHIRDLGLTWSGRTATGTFGYLGTLDVLDRAGLTERGVVRPAAEALGVVAAHTHPVSHVYLVDPDGVILGCGQTGYHPVGLLAPWRQAPPRTEVWRGFVVPGPAATRVRALVEFEGDPELRELEGTHLLPGRQKEHREGSGP